MGITACRRPKTIRVSISQEEARPATSEEVMISQEYVATGASAAIQLAFRCLIVIVMKQPPNAAWNLLEEQRNVLPKMHEQCTLKHDTGGVGRACAARAVLGGNATGYSRRPDPAFQIVPAAVLLYHDRPDTQVDPVS